MQVVRRVVFVLTLAEHPTEQLQNYLAALKDGQDDDGVLRQLAVFQARTSLPKPAMESLELFDALLSFLEPTRVGA